MKNYICFSIEVVGLSVSNHLCYFVFAGKPFCSKIAKQVPLQRGHRKMTIF